jgi:hypothetical protein
MGVGRCNLLIGRSGNAALLCPDELSPQFLPRSAGVPIVLFEVPTAPILREHLPLGAFDRFRRSVAAIADAHGLTFLTIDELGLALTRLDFREPSHLNPSGGETLTRAVAQRLVIPVLRRDGAADSTRRQGAPPDPVQSTQ